MNKIVKIGALCILLFCLACSDKKKQQSTQNDTKITNDSAITKEETPAKESTETSLLDTGCYEYNSNGNTIKMEITKANGNITGNLNIAYAKKDDNQGTFDGKLNGDKLIGTYTFNAEGKESTREMAFLVKNNQLIEGYGELNENGTKFKDVNNIKYTSTMPLTKVDCNK